MTHKWSNLRSPTSGLLNRIANCLPGGSNFQEYLKWETRSRYTILSSYCLWPQNWVSKEGKLFWNVDYQLSEGQKSLHVWDWEYYINKVKWKRKAGHKTILYYGPNFVQKKKKPKMLISYFCVVEESDFNCYSSLYFPSSLQGICILY